MNRKLGILEKWYWLFEQTSPINIQVSLQMCGGLDKKVFIKALKYIQNRHPLLQVSISVNADKELCFVDTNKDIPFSYIEFRGLFNIQKFLQEDVVKTTVNKNDPLVRVIYLRVKEKNIIVFTINHMITGGIGLNYLLDTLFKTYVDLKLGKKLVGEKFPERPPIEEILPRCSKKIQRITQYSAEVADLHTLSDKEKLWNNRSYDLRLKVSKNKTKQIINLSEKHQTTVHGFLCAIGVIALRKYLREIGDKKAEGSINSMTPVNLRPYLTLDLCSSELSSFVSGAFVTCDDVSKDVWSLARKIKKGILVFLENKQFVDNILGLSEIIKKYNSPEKIAAFYKGKWSIPTIGITNLGMVPISSLYGDVKITDINISANFPYIWNNPGALPLICYTFNNNLNINFIYTYPTMKSSQVKLFKKIFVNLIEDVLFK